MSGQSTKRNFRGLDYVKQFWDDAVSKDGEEKTTKEEKLDLSKPISKSPKSDIVVFTNPLDIQIDFKEIQLALPKSQ